MQQGHHLFTRKSAGAARFPARWKKAIDNFAYIIAVVAPFSYAPQVFKIYARQDAGGLALSTFVLLFFINIVWLLYGWAHRSKPLVITSILFCAFHVLIISGIMLF